MKAFVNFDEKKTLSIFCMCVFCVSVISLVNLLIVFNFSLQIKNMQDFFMCDILMCENLMVEFHGFFFRFQSFSLKEVEFFREMFRESELPELQTRAFWCEGYQKVKTYCDPVTPDSRNICLKTQFRWEKILEHGNKLSSIYMLKKKHYKNTLKKTLK